MTHGRIQFLKIPLDDQSPAHVGRDLDVSIGRQHGHSTVVVGLHNAAIPAPASVAGSEETAPSSGFGRVPSTRGCFRDVRFFRWRLTNRASPFSPSASPVCSSGRSMSSTRNSATITAKGLPSESTIARLMDNTGSRCGSGCRMSSIQSPRDFCGSVNRGCRWMSLPRSSRLVEAITTPVSASAARMRANSSERLALSCNRRSDAAIFG